jgi:hypothetical protein
MRPSLPVVVLVLVVATTVATATPAPPSSAGPVASDAATGSQALEAPVEPVENTSEYLALPSSSDSRSGFGNATLDVAGAAALEDEQLDERYLEQQTLVAFRTADNETMQTRIIERAIDDMENRTDALNQQQARTIDQYNRGTISTTTFLRRLGRIGARADAISETPARLRATVERNPSYSLPSFVRSRLKSLPVKTNIHSGPVRGTVARAIVGDSGRQRVYTQTTSQDVVLARVSGNSYVREAFVASEYDPTGDNEFGRDINLAYDRTQDLYPWVFRNVIGNPSAEGFAQIYRIEVDHSHGELITFISGSSTNAFREVQDKRLSELPYSRNVTATSGNLTVRAGLTHDTGPMSLSVTRTGTGDPVDADVTVDGENVGSTGSDGLLWTIQPRGQVTVDATTAANETVSLQFR